MQIQHVLQARPADVAANRETLSRGALGTEVAQRWFASECWRPHLLNPDHGALFSSQTAFGTEGSGLDAFLARGARGPTFPAAVFKWIVEPGIGLHFRRHLATL